MMNRLYFIPLIGMLLSSCAELDIKRVDPIIETISPEAAVPGSTLTITGAHFTDDVVVSFNTVDAEIIEVSANTLKVEVPQTLSPSTVDLKIDAQGAPITTDYEILAFFEERTAHPDGAFGGTGFVIDDVLYFGMGGAPWYQYNVNSDTWTPMTANNAGPNKAGAIGVTINGKGYVLGIGTDKELWEYDPGTKNWTLKSEYPNNQLLIPAVVVIGLDLYLATGYHDGITDEVWKYSTVDDEWSQVNDFAGVKRGDAVGFSIDGTGYVGQGYDFDTNSLLNDFYAYNTTSDTWTEISAPLNPSANLEGGIGFSLGDKGYIGLGRNGSSPVKNFWKYNPAEDSWQQFATYPGNGVMGVQAFVVANKVYLINGSSQTYSEDYVEMWEFTPESL